MVKREILLDEDIGMVDDGAAVPVLEIMAVFMGGCEDLLFERLGAVHQSECGSLRLKENKNTRYL
jgi:hypothetical protein